MDGRTQGNWSEIQLTTVPNDDSNINAGVLPKDNGVFLVSNAVPAKVRDPITLSISRDGFDWSSCRVAQTCTDFPDLPKSTCKARYDNSRFLFSIVTDRALRKGEIEGEGG